MLLLRRLYLLLSHSSSPSGGFEATNVMKSAKIKVEDRKAAGELILRDESLGVSNFDLKDREVDEH